MSVAKIIAIVVGIVVVCVVLVIAFNISVTSETVLVEERTGNQEGRTIQTAKQIDDVKISLSVQPNPVVSGENLALELSATNIGNEPHTFSFRSSQRYDFWVADSDGKEVWRWSDDMMFAQMLEDIVLQPNQKVDYREDWNLTGSNGSSLKAGDYRVFAVISSDELKDRELMLDVEIQAAGK